MPGTRQRDELIVSSASKHGNVRAEFSGTLVDILHNEHVLDSIVPPIFIETTRHLRLVLKVWIAHNEKNIPALRREALIRDHRRIR